MCDTIAAVSQATRNGCVIFGKNSDREFDEAQYLTRVDARDYPEDASVKLTYMTIPQVRHTHGVLLSKPHWIWGAEIGANSHGLVIGNEALFSKIDASMAPGIIGMDYLRLALERAADVGEAIHVITTLLSQFGQSGNCGYRDDLAYYNSYILADAHGAQKLETIDREWVVQPITSYDAISNAPTIGKAYSQSSVTLIERAQTSNLYSGSRPFAFDVVYADQDQSVSGHYRRGRALELLSEADGHLEVSDFFKVLRDHKEGPPIKGRANPRICAHSTVGQLGKTTASWVSSVTSGNIVHWVTGTSAPCTSVYKPLLGTSSLPDMGPLPGEGKDKHSLWWRHERLLAYLEREGEAVRTDFAVERDNLERIMMERVNAWACETRSPRDEDGQAVVRSCWRDAMMFEQRWTQRAYQS